MNSELNSKANNEKRIKIEKMLEDYKFSKKSREKPQKDPPLSQNIKNFQSVPSNLNDHQAFKKSMENPIAEESDLRDQDDNQIINGGNEVVLYKKDIFALSVLF